MKSVNFLLILKSKFSFFIYNGCQIVSMLRYQTYLTFAEILSNKLAISVAIVLFEK